MKTRNAFISALLPLIAFLGQRSAHAADAKDIALQYFPEKLKSSILKAAKGRPVNLGKFVRSVSGDLDGTGAANYVIAVYFDGSDGTLRVIRTDNNSPTLAAESTQVDLYGVRGGPKLIDLNSDKKPEIIVSFMSDRGNTSSWIFAWSEHSLKLISPLTQEGSTNLGSIEFFDLSGNGQLSVVTQQPEITPRIANGPPIVLPTEAYSLTSSGLVLSDTFYFQDSFERESGAPSAEEVKFDIEDSSKAYILHIVDLNLSKPDKGPLISSSEVWLNGVQVVASSAFKPGVRRKEISLPVRLKDSNQIRVKLSGPPGSKMLVTLTHAK